MSKEFADIDERPFTVIDVQKILGLSKNLTYKLVQEAYETQYPFPVLKFGTIYRIPKEKFMRYVRGDPSSNHNEKEQM